jgi:hypothetical protein
MKKTFYLPKYYTIEIEVETGFVEIYSSSKHAKGRELKQKTNNKGYLIANMNSRTYPIHSLVAKFILGERPHGLCVNHIDGNKLNTSASFNTVTGSNIAGDNAWKLLTSISGAFATDPVNYSFQSRNSIVRTSAHYFVRVKNTEYNFTHYMKINPSSRNTSCKSATWNCPSRKGMQSMTLLISSFLVSENNSKSNISRVFWNLSRSNS